MFWHKQPKPTYFSLDKHLPAAKKYIREQLEYAKEREHIRYSVRDPGVQYSLRGGELEDTTTLRSKYFSWEAKQRSRNTFSSKVLGYLADKQFDPRVFYRQAGMDRKLFSKLKTDFCYQPKKETAIRCCLALQLTVTEAADLLKTAGYALSDSNSFDLAIRYCLDNGIYDLAAVNVLLEALEEHVLG